MDQTDAILLAEWVNRRDSDAFMELVVRHSTMVFATCMRITGNAADAEEVAQECFLELSRAGASVKNLHAGWLHSVARKRSALRVRAEVRRKAREKAYMDTVQPQAETGWEEVVPELDACIAELPEDLRNAVVLRFLEALTYEELSKRLGVPISTLQYRIKKALETLRDSLKRRGVLVGSAAALGALLEVNAAEASAVPASLATSLGEMVLAQGAVGAGGAAAATVLGVLAMKKAAAVVLCVSVLAGLAFLGRSYLAAHEPDPPAATETMDAGARENVVYQSDVPVKPSPSVKRDASLEIMLAAAEKAAANGESYVPPEGNVSGMVVHGDTGEPVPGVVLSARCLSTPRDPWPDHRLEGTILETDARGRFAFHANEIGHYHVELRDNTYALLDDPFSISVVITEMRPERHDLLLKVGLGASISGRVYDKETGKGLPDVRVGARGAHADTDDDGRYTIRAAPTGEHSVTVWEAGSYVVNAGAEATRCTVSVEPGQELTGVDFALEMGIELRGALVNKEGEAIAGRHAFIMGPFADRNGAPVSCRSERVEIDDNGKFVFTGIPAAIKSFTLSLDVREYPPTETQRFYSSYYAEGEEVWTGERVFVLEDSGRLRLRVLDADTRKPITSFEWAKLHHGSKGLSGSSEHFVGHVSSPEGVVEVPLSEHRATIFVRAEGYAQNLTDFEGAAPRELVEAEILMVPGGLIRGTVTDFEGAVIRLACIFVGEPTGTPSRSARRSEAQTTTDSYGDFKLPVAAGRHVITAWADGLGERQATVDVPVSGEVHVALVLGEGGGRIRGRITREGQPIQARVLCTVEAPEKDAAYVEETRADTDGTYQFAGVTAGEGVVKIVDGGYDPDARVALIAVEVADDLETLVDYDFPPLGATVTGRVLLNGQPIERAMALVYSEETGEDRRVELQGGAFELSNAPAGEMVLAITYMHEKQRHVHREAIMVPDDGFIEHDVAITLRGGGEVSGQVILGDAGLDVRVIEVGLLEGELSLADLVLAEYLATAALVTGIMARNGAYTLRNVPAGEYSVVARVTTTDRETTMDKDVLFGLAHVSVADGESQTVDFHIP